MNLRDRIVKSGKKRHKTNIIELKKESDIFVKNIKVEKIIKDAVLNNDNIILICSKDVDKYIACNYIKEFSYKQSVEIINDTGDDLKYSSAERVIIPEPSISDVINIFKSVIEGFKTFVFAINVKYFKNILETIKLLILLEHPNLTEKNVEHMLGLSSSVILNVIRNEDGLFEITDADKIYYDCENLIFENLLSGADMVMPDVSIKEITVEDDNTELDDMEISGAEEVYNIRDEEKQAPEHNENIENSKEDTKPVNKYKLLKEKVRKKRALK